MFPCKRHNYYNIGRKCKMKKRDSIHIIRTYVYVLCSTYIYTHVYVHSTYRGFHTDGRGGIWDSSAP